MDEGSQNNEPEIECQAQCSEHMDMDGGRRSPRGVWISGTRGNWLLASILKGRTGHVDEYRIVQKKGGWNSNPQQFRPQTLGYDFIPSVSIGGCTEKIMAQEGMGEVTMLLLVKTLKLGWSPTLQRRTLIG